PRRFAVVVLTGPDDLAREELAGAVLLQRVLAAGGRADEVVVVRGCGELARRVVLTGVELPRILVGATSRRRGRRLGFEEERAGVLGVKAVDRLRRVVVDAEAVEHPQD